MIDMKELRRLAQQVESGEAGINELVAFVESSEPKTIIELLDRLENAEKTKNNWLRANAPGGWIDDLRMERNALHARIKEMEQQELSFRERCTPSSPTGYSNRFPLYALPGAKGE